MNDQRQPDERRREGGSNVGRTDESGADTVPGGVQPGDERIAAHSTESSGVGKAEDRVEGRDDEWPAGHREGEADRPPIGIRKGSQGT